VWVKIHFWDVDVANVVSATLKDGSYEWKSQKGYVWCSYLYVQNIYNAKLFIDIKFNETMEVWAKARKQL
jgi:hypothetical protein